MIDTNAPQMMQSDWDLSQSEDQEVIRARRAGQEPETRTEHLDELREVSFGVSLRGYACAEVDRYVKRVARVVSELEASLSPDAAVRSALARVGEQTGAILERASDSAEEIIHSARSEATDMLARSKAEAQAILGESKTEATQMLIEATEAARAERQAAAETLALAQEQKSELIAEGQAELQSLAQKGRENYARSEAALARAQAEASELTQSAQAKAEDTIAEAKSKAAEHLAREQERLSELYVKAKDAMQALSDDTLAIEAKRERMFAEIGELAERLAELIPAQPVVLRGVSGAGAVAEALAA